MNGRRYNIPYERYFFLSILIVSFFTILALLYVYENVEYTSLSYRYMQLKKEYSTLTKENQLLRYKVEKLSSPSRIEKYARAKLGMVYPQKTVYIDILPSEVNMATLSTGKYIASP